MLKSLFSYPFKPTTEQILIIIPWDQEEIYFSINIWR